jgi:hypothetical protein
LTSPDSSSSNNKHIKDFLSYNDRDDGKRVGIDHAVTPYDHCRRGDRTGELGSGSASGRPNSLCLKQGVTSRLLVKIRAVTVNVALLPDDEKRDLLNDNITKLK